MSKSDAYALAAIIPAGQTASQQVDLGGGDLCGLFFPAAFTGASVKLLAAPADGGPYYPVQKDESGGGDYAVAAAPGKYAPVTALPVVAGLRFVQLVSASAEAAERRVVLARRPV